MRLPSVRRAWTREEAGLRRTRSEGTFGRAASSGAKFRDSDRSYILKPLRQKHVLTGKMALHSPIGQRLLNARWPLPVAAAIVCVSTVLGPIGFAGMVNATEEHKGVMGAPVTLVRYNTSALVASNIFELLWLFILMHKVHRKLFVMTLTSFDPWVIVVSSLRAGAARVYSRLALTGDFRTLAEDATMILQLLLIGVIVAFLESAQVGHLTKQIGVAMIFFCVACAVFVSLLDGSTWDPDQTVGIFWICTMSPRSQYTSALFTVLVIVAKGAYSLFMSRDFMFLRTHFELDKDDFYELFLDLDKGNNGVLLMEDWRSALEGSVTEAEIQAGYKALDRDEVGVVTFRSFRRALVGYHIEYPDHTPFQHLTVFCVDSARTLFGVAPALCMVKMVLSQWSQIDIEVLGKDVCEGLADNPASAKFFGDTSMKTHAAIIVGMLSMAFRWLGDKKLLDVECRMCLLGERHARVGVNVLILRVFEVLFFASLRNQLGESFEDSKHAWTFIWIRFISEPFCAGLCKASGMRPETAVDIVMDSFQALKESASFGSILFDRLFEIHPRAESVFSRTNITLHKGMFVAFVGRALGMLKNPDRGRAELRDLARLHHNVGVGMVDFIFFEEAFMHALRQIPQMDESEDIMFAWLYVIRHEIIETQLRAPFANVDDRLAAIAIDTTSQYSREEWPRIADQLGVKESQTQKDLFEAMCNEDGYLDLRTFKRVIMNQSMTMPYCSFDEVIASMCPAKGETKSWFASSSMVWKRKETIANTVPTRKGQAWTCPLNRRPHPRQTSVVPAPDPV